MEQTTTTTRPSRRAQAHCVHHWIIASPNGRESQGHCKHCGKTKDFVNSTASVMWEQTNTIRNDLRGGARSSKTAEIKLADEE
ncbi:MAG: hypothetical protein O3B31_06700 [Chloroflexi bacterium]|nr:hypothetical protein [Chloroflexota bacterium]MQC27714.1 hypothetical protein [Chloroflexota bacterium]